MDLGLQYAVLCPLYCLPVVPQVIKKLLIDILKELCNNHVIFVFLIRIFRFYTLVPAGILVGLGAAPMWASKATYLTQVGQVYAKITEQAVDAIIVRFFGFFFLAWQTAELWGNLISSLGK